MFKTLSSKEEQEFIKWAQDNYHEKVGVSGNIRALWHPVVRKEMHRLKRLQMQKIREKANEIATKKGASI